MINYKAENVPYGYFVLNNGGLIRDVNITFLNWLGYEYDELIHTNIEALLSIASKMLFHSVFFLQLQLNGRVDEVNLTVRGKNGLTIPVMLMGYRENCNNEELIRCIAVKMAKRYDYENELRAIKVELEEAYQSKNAALEQESELRKLLKTTLLSIGEGIIVTDAAGKITLMNPIAQRYLACSHQAAFGKDIEDVANIIDSNTRRQIPSHVREVLTHGITLDFANSTMLVSKDGSERFIEGTAAPIYSDDNKITGVVIAFRDITKQYLQEKEIDGFLNVNLDMLCVADLDANFHRVNKKFEEVLGYSTEDIVGKSFLSFIHEDDIKDTLEVVKELANHERVTGFINRYRCKDGSYKYIEWQAQPGIVNFIYASARDITEKKMQEEKLRHLSYHDQLTGLYNRQFLNTIIDDEMTRSDRYEQKLTLCIMDLDHFKNVNDTWGHPIGDELLKLTAETAWKHKRNSDLLIRFGGEEFVILMPGTNLDGAILALEKIREAIANINHAVTGKQTVSIGVAERLKHEAFFDWYKRADDALYRAKHEGRNRVAASI